MRKVHSDGKYDYYYKGACGDDPALYNIVPYGSAAPSGGYENMGYIEKIKGVLFPLRYQPEANGMRKLFPGV